MNNNQDRNNNSKSNNKNNNSSTAAQKIESHFTIGIGASAGGLEAINELFDNMPKGSSFSFIIIQHLSPDYKSLMSELLSKHTRMKVTDAEDGMLVLPENVYVIPSKKNMTIRNKKLRLIDKNPTTFPNTAIDIFFHSLAKEKKEHSICVILSGTGTDGTKGAMAVKEAGGLVIVQDPNSAKFNGMPNSAISSGLADHILTPPEMATHIYKFARSGKSKTPVSSLSDHGDEEHVNDIIDAIKNSTKQDFSYYKRQTITRRIAKRMAFLSITKLKNYVAYIENNDEEISTLRKEFLIGVTRFFRDEPAFELVKRNVFPDLLEKKLPNEPLKIWVVACSTGQEAYSLAIVIKEYFEANYIDLEVKIFATDVDSDAVDFAAKGKYPKEIEAEVSSERLEKYFVENGTGYSISQNIRKMVVFAQHNIIQDPLFSKLDMLSCRNLLIYMKPVLQNEVLSTFHFSLNLGGYLFLGPSENANDLSNVLEDVNKKWNIYRKIKESERYVFNPNLAAVADSKGAPQMPLLSKINKNVAQNRINAVFCETVAEELVAGAAVIDSDYNLVQATGDYKTFIELPEHRFQLNLLKLVCTEISVALSVALRKINNSNLKVARKRVKLKKGNKVQIVDLVVKPFISQEDVTKQLIMVFFKESDVEQQITDKESNAFDTEMQADRHKELELELKETKESLHTLMEEMETANEELQSSNEELLSSNEELQSTNEELQSLNEELHTVNAEHQQKIKELIELNDDFDNYFRSTQIAQIFVDKNLLIRKYTPSVFNQINIIEADIGRPISHFSHNIKYESLVADITQVIETSEEIEKEIEVTNGENNYLMRVLPYIKQDKQTDGAVVTFVDITTLKRLNNILAGVLNSSIAGISAFKCIEDKDGQVVDLEWTLANASFGRMFNLDSDALTGKKLLENLPQMKHVGLFKEFAKVIENGKSLHTQFLFEQKFFEVMGVSIDHGIALTFADITEKKNSEQKMLKAYGDLKKADENLRQLNNNLELKVKERTLELSRSDERFRLVSEATNDAVWDWNLVTNQIWWNESYKNLFGCDKKEAEKGIQSWYDRIHPTEKKRVVKGLNHVINTSKKQWSDEYRFRRKDGSYAHVYNRGYVLYNENGTPYRMLGSKVDLTNLKEVEDELRQSNEDLKTINHDLDSFIYTASHDLKSPIANLEGLVNLLKRLLDGRLKEKEVKLIEMIDSSICKFNNTIKGLTEITKVQKDMEKSISTVSFDTTLTTVKEDIDYMISESKAIIEADFQVENILYNASHLKSIFYNFLSNAIKYRSEDRPLKINIATKKLSKYIMLTIEDNGLGMNRDQQQKLFSMFKRFHTHVEGTGIGLYIIKRIIENKNGKIEVESKENQGTVFKIFFDITPHKKKGSVLETV